MDDNYTSIDVDVIPQNEATSAATTPTPSRRYSSLPNQLPSQTSVTSNSSRISSNSARLTSLDILPPGSPSPSNIRNRHRSIGEHSVERSGSYIAEEDGFEENCVVITPENVIEAHRMVNNYKFGFKKWKSHVTSRPLSVRSDIVKDLYADIAAAKPVRGDQAQVNYVNHKASWRSICEFSTLRPTNVVYVLLIGWWLSLTYLFLALLLTITVIGWPYAKFCLKMARYLFWPFGKFIYYIHKSPLESQTESLYFERMADTMHESTSLIRSERTNTGKRTLPICGKDFWRSVCTYPWLLIGVPVLVVIHAFIVFITWMFVITIPLSKVNQKMLMCVMWLPPGQVRVGDSDITSLDPERSRSEIIMYTHQSVSIYYYKYTVDGMNIILVNLLLFVVLSIAFGYADPDNKISNGVSKCVLSIFAIIPLTYYIGMAIISISAQSSYAIGAVLNATFGSVVELILYVVSLLKGKQRNTKCYAELVKSGLAGTLVGCVLFIPGICMVVGGLKYRSQRFNPKSASVTALLLFVAIGGVFAPTLFSKIFGDLQCDKCEMNTTHPFSNSTGGFQCTGCTQTLLGLDGDRSLFEKHIQPLVYAIAIVLPLAYICGVVFTLKTHTSYIYDEFNQQLADDTEAQHGAPQWSRMKSLFILICCAVLIALCADLIADNIQELLQTTDISEYFVGVTLIAMIPELPEIINGIQFALQNNVNLGIEIGTNCAIQVCLIQVPALVLIDLIYPLDFLLVFNDVHFWAVVFSVIVINYIFQDGKTNYFQGTALIAIYVILLCMYFFVPTPDSAKC